MEKDKLKKCLLGISKDAVTRFDRETKEVNIVIDTFHIGALNCTCTASQHRVFLNCDTLCTHAAQFSMLHGVWVCMLRKVAVETAQKCVSCSTIQRVAQSASQFAQRYLTSSSS